MGGGVTCNKSGARSPAAHLPHFVRPNALRHSVPDGRRERNLDFRRQVSPYKHSIRCWTTASGLMAFMQEHSIV